MAKSVMWVVLIEHQEHEWTTEAVASLSEQRVSGSFTNIRTSAGCGFVVTAVHVRVSVWNQGEGGHVAERVEDKQDGRLRCGPDVHNFHPACLLHFKCFHRLQL